MAQAQHASSCFFMSVHAVVKTKEVSPSSAAASGIGQFPAAWVADAKQSRRILKVRRVECSPRSDFRSQIVCLDQSSAPWVVNRDRSFLSGVAQSSASNRGHFAQCANHHKKHKLRLGKCAAGAEDKAVKSASLADVAAKGLSLQPLSLEEQIELERQLEERQLEDARNEESESPVPLSGLVRNKVLEGLEEQVELEERGLLEGSGGGLDTIPTDGEQDSLVSSDDVVADHSVRKEGRLMGLGSVKEVRQVGPVSLSEVAKGGFGSGGLSLSGQVELERLAEEGETYSRETDRNEPTTSRPDRISPTTNSGLKIGSGATTKRQNEIEAALERKLQEVLKQHEPFSMIAFTEDQGKTTETSRQASVGVSVLAGKRFPLEEVSLLRVVTSEAENALATLRAQVFYSYPDVQKMTAAQRVTARSEFRTKLKENKQEEQGVIDFLRAMKRPDHAVLALVDLPLYQSLLSESGSVQNLDPSESVTGKAPEPDPFHDVILRPATLKRTEMVTDGLGSFEVEQEMAVVGSFALQVGGKLAGQNLVGQKPADVERQTTERGYLYSVAVLPTIRRMGLGHNLVEEAKSLARDLGIKHLYVHVELSNHGAERLYKETGFVSEQEESEEVAKSLKRPRRQILCCDL